VKRITEFHKAADFDRRFFFLLISVFRKYLENRKLYKCAVCFARKGVLSRLFEYHMSINIGYIKVILRIFVGILKF